MNNIVIILLCFIIIFTGCDNQEQLKKTKRENNSELEIIEKQRIASEDSIALLNEEINKLASQKDSLLQIEKYQRLAVYDIIKQSRLNHVILGSNDLNSAKTFYSDILGFTTKIGNKHSNGLENLFIEFENDTEIELMSVSNPTDFLAETYDSLINRNINGLSFALRTPEIKKLNNYLPLLDNEFNSFRDLYIYQSLSKKKYNAATPFFFIKYKNEVQNKLIKHENGANGISAVWLSAKDIRGSIKYYSEFGFSLIDTLSIADIKNKTALIRNDNFELILIEDSKNQISGITISVTDINLLADLLNDRLKKELKIKTTKRGKSLYLNPRLSNSVYLEFIEN